VTTESIDKLHGCLDQTDCFCLDQTDCFCLDQTDCLIKLTASVWIKLTASVWIKLTASVWIKLTASVWIKLTASCSYQGITLGFVPSVASLRLAIQIFKRPEQQQTNQKAATNRGLDQ
jgi:hypothetical protein